VRNFAKIAQPLTDLTKKENAFSWTAECETSFKALKQALMSAPCLELFDPKNKIRVVCDAS